MRTGCHLIVNSLSRSCKRVVSSETDTHYEAENCSWGGGQVANSGRFYSRIGIFADALSVAGGRLETFYSRILSCLRLLKKPRGASNEQDFALTPSAMPLEVTAGPRIHQPGWLPGCAATADPFAHGGRSDHVAFD